MGSYTARKLPSEVAIREYWRDRLWREKGFDSPDEFMEPSVCFACGIADHDIEKAHIKARCEGGTDSPDNIHMLCPICHRDSEALTGGQYFKWLGERTFMDMAISASCRAGFNPWHETRQRGKEP